MEILGLVPFQSETQYLEQKFRVIAEWQQSGNARLLLSAYHQEIPGNTRDHERHRPQLAKVRLPFDFCLNLSVESCRRHHP